MALSQLCFLCIGHLILSLLSEMSTPMMLFLNCLDQQVPYDINQHTELGSLGLFTLHLTPGYQCSKHRF